MHSGEEVSHLYSDVVQRLVLQNIAYFGFEGKRDYEVLKRYYVCAESKKDSACNNRHAVWLPGTGGTYGMPVSGAGCAYPGPPAFDQLFPGAPYSRSLGCFLHYPGDKELNVGDVASNGSPNPVFGAR
jgi:hypothetical protein